MNNPMASIPRTQGATGTRPHRHNAAPEEGFIHTFLSVNPFRFMMNAFLLRLAETESSRAKAVEGLGRSGSRMATRSLVQAMEDPSSEVRKRAVTALGGIRATDAVPILIRELEDHESDVRCEAAEALGRIGDRSAVPPLLKLITEQDPRLRNASVSALGEIGGEDVRERLLELFSVSYDSSMFPALADSLSRLGADEIVEPVMKHLGSFESMVFRLQLLNAVCRALGAGTTFYRILSKHEYDRVNEVNRLIRRARRDVRRSPVLRKDLAASMRRTLADISISYRNEDHRGFLRAVWEFMASIQLILPEIPVPAGSGRPGDRPRPDRIRPSIEAVNRFLALKETEDIRDEGMVFLVICIGCLLSVM